MSGHCKSCSDIILVPGSIIVDIIGFIECLKLGPVNVLFAQPILLIHLPDDVLVLWPGHAIRAVKLFRELLYHVKLGALFQHGTCGGSGQGLGMGLGLGQ